LAESPAVLGTGSAFVACGGAAAPSRPAPMSTPNPFRRPYGPTTVLAAALNPSSAWAQELTQLEAQVRAKLGESAPRLRFAVGPLPAPGQEPVPEAERSVHRPTEADSAEADRIVRGIEAEAVREAVREACALSFAVQRAARTDRPRWRKRAAPSASPANASAKSKRRR